MDISTLASLPVANPAQFLFCIILPGVILYYMLRFIQQFEIKSKQMQPELILQSELKFDFFKDVTCILLIGISFYVISPMILDIPSILKFLFNADQVLWKPYFLSNSPFGIILRGLISLSVSLSVSALLFLPFFVAYSARKCSDFLNKVKYPSRIKPLVSVVVVLLLLIPETTATLLFLPYLLQHMPWGMLVPSEYPPVIVKTSSCSKDSTPFSIWVINYHESPLFFRVYSDLGPDEDLHLDINRSLIAGINVNSTPTKDRTGNLTNPIYINVTVNGISTVMTEQIIGPYGQVNANASLHDNSTFIYVQTNYGIYPVHIKCNDTTTYYGELD